MRRCPHAIEWGGQGDVRLLFASPCAPPPLPTFDSAGPVVAAACILPPGVHAPGVDDSKKLNEAQREAAYEALTSTPGVLWAV